MNDWVLGFETLGMADVPRVGGKNASLGEMIRHLTAAGVSVPTTSSDGTRTRPARDASQMPPCASAMVRPGLFTNPDPCSHSVAPFATSPMASWPPSTPSRGASAHSPSRSGWIG